MGRPAGGKGDVRKKEKKTPEEFGFQLVDGSLYVREPQLQHAFPVDIGSGEYSCMEIGTLGKRADSVTLPQGTAELEVLCNRQTILGNPFSMLRDSGYQTSKGSSLDMAIGLRKPPMVREPEDGQLRDRVCNMFDHFLGRALAQEGAVSLLEVAIETANNLGEPRGLIGKDWTQEFGARTCREFQDAYRSLSAGMMKHRGRIRLMCHCVPLRCHASSIAVRLLRSLPLASEASSGLSCSDAPVIQAATSCRESCNNFAEHREPELQQTVGHAAAPGRAKRWGKAKKEDPPCSSSAYHRDAVHQQQPHRCSSATEHVLPTRDISRTRLESAEAEKGPSEETNDIQKP
jgi:hypothetical protein